MWLNLLFISVLCTPGSVAMTAWLPRRVAYCRKCAFYMTGCPATASLHFPGHFPTFPIDFWVDNGQGQLTTGNYQTQTPRRSHKPIKIIFNALSREKAISSGVGTSESNGKIGKLLHWQWINLRCQQSAPAFSIAITNSHTVAPTHWLAG